MAVTPQTDNGRSKLAMVAGGIKGLVRGIAEGLAENTTAGRILIDPFIETQNERLAAARIAKQDMREEKQDIRYQSTVERQNERDEKQDIRFEQQWQVQQEDRQKRDDLRKIDLGKSAARARAMQEQLAFGVDPDEAGIIVDNMPDTLTIDAFVGLYGNGQLSAAKQLLRENGMSMAQDDKGQEVIVLTTGQKVPFNERNLIAVRDAVAKPEMQNAQAIMFQQRAKKNVGQKVFADGMGKIVAAGGTPTEAGQMILPLLKQWSVDQKVVSHHTLAEALEKAQTATFPSQLKESLQQFMTFLPTSGLQDAIEPNPGTGIKDSFFNLKQSVAGLGQAGTMVGVEEMLDYLNKTDKMAQSVNNMVALGVEKQRPKQLKTLLTQAFAAGQTGQELPSLPFDPTEAEQVQLDAAYQNGKNASVKTEDQATQRQQAIDKAEAAKKPKKSSLDKYLGATASSLE